MLIDLNGMYTYTYIYFYKYNLVNIFVYLYVLLNVSNQIISIFLHCLRFKYDWTNIKGKFQRFSEIF